MQMPPLVVCVRIPYPCVDMRGGHQAAAGRLEAPEAYLVRKDPRDGRIPVYSFSRALGRSQHDCTRLFSAMNLTSSGR